MTLTLELNISWPECTDGICAWQLQHKKNYVWRVNQKLEENSFNRNQVFFSFSVITKICGASMTNIFKYF